MSQNQSTTASTKMQPPVTPGYWLRKQFLHTKAVQDDHSLQAYAELLQKQGLEINPCLYPAFFQLRNGLRYPGIKTNKRLTGPEILVKVPKKLILTTRIALAETALKQIYKQPFYKCSRNWQDRVLATFLLHIYAHKTTIWYHMMQYMSRDIDILCFWPSEDIAKFNDKDIELIVKDDLQKFEDEWELFEMLNKKHKCIDPDVATKENYKWIYIHLISRCFGQFLECISMVPFCEFFNHHNSDVLYDFLYNQNNPHKDKQVHYDPPGTYEDDEKRDALSSSSGTYSSKDCFDEREIDYSNVDVHKIRWGTKVSFDLDQKNTKTVKNKLDELEKALGELNWEEWSVLFVAQILERLRIADNEYLAGRKKYYDTNQNINYLRQLLYAFKKNFDELKALTKEQKSQVDRDSDDDSDYDVQKEYPKLEEDKFDYFILTTNKRDLFQPQDQVYFCYGRLSNRLMLKRYGMAIEGNKYDHIYVKINIVKYLCGYPDMLEKMQDRRVSVVQRFKVKRWKFNLQVLQFFRMVMWDLGRHKLDDLFYVFDLDQEIKVLEKAQELYKSYLAKYPPSEQLEQKLKSKETGYHEYFISVYKLEHVRTLSLQLHLIDIAKTIIQKLQNQKELSFDDIAQAPAGKERDYWYLKEYFTRLRHCNRHS